MSKFFKRIAKDKIKCTADFVLTEVSVLVSGEAYFRVEIQRGKQQP